MSGLQKYIVRHDPDKAARLMALSQKQGYVDSEGRTLGLSSQPEGTDGPLSNRRLLGEKARISSVNRTSRSASPALSAASREWQRKVGSMAPPQRAASELQIKARPPADLQNADDMFATDIENADATTTASNLSLDDTSASWSHHLDRAIAKPSNLYHQSETKYGGGLPPMADERYEFAPRRVTALSGDEQIIEEGYTEDDESSIQGSDENQSQYDRIIEPDALPEYTHGEHSNGALTYLREAPISKVLQSLIDSPSKKMPMENMAFRSKERKVHRSEQNLSTEPQNLEGPPTVAPNVVNKVQQTNSEHPIKYIQEEVQRGFPEDEMVLRSQEFQSSEIQQPLKLHFKQHAAAEQHPATQLAGNQQLPENPPVPLAGVEPHTERKESLGHNLAHGNFQADSMAQGNVEKLESIAPNAEHVLRGQSAAESTGTQPSKKATVVEKYGMTKPAGLQKTSREPAETSAKPLIKKPEHRKRALELDYTPQEMSGMPYKILNSESFDHIPKPGSSAIPNEVIKLSLPEKLKYAYNLKDREVCEAQRNALFASLTIDQHEETGDLIIQQFSDILGRYKDARKAKRDAAREFEKEIAQREERVRSKTTAVEADLQRLKRGAEDVVRGPGRER